jgi:hypothetical protein
MHVLYKRGLLRAGVITAAVLPAVVLGQGAGMASTHKVLSKVVNLINDPGAEKAKTSAGGVVTVPGWTVAKTSGFTAVKYGTAGGFPGPGNHLPKAKGKWFFAGGDVSGAISTGSQIDSLAKYKKLISGKHAKFTLSAWLGGFSTQTDHATLTVTWLSGADKALGHTTIGPVTEAQRDGNTGLWFRSTSGKVPGGARFALVTLRMTREQGSYNDGYADNLSLTLVRAKR